MGVRRLVERSRANLVKPRVLLTASCVALFCLSVVLWNSADGFDDVMLTTFLVIVFTMVGWVAIGLICITVALGAWDFCTLQRGQS